MSRRITSTAVLFFCQITFVFASGGTEAGLQSDDIVAPEDTYPQYLSLVDGLHVTGTPIEVDIDTYRLTISGNVAHPLSLSFEDVKKRDKTRMYLELNCPGYFTDKGFWTGVYVRDLLEEAGIGPDAHKVRFISIDGSYTKTLSLTDIQETNVLVVYEFEDKEFPVYHGFPLRIAVEGMAGSNWVKWLGSIVVD